MIYAHVPSGGMGVSLGSEWFAQAVAAVLAPASLLRNLGGRPSLQTRISVLKLQITYDIRLLYRTFPIKWNRAKLCSR